VRGLNPHPHPNVTPLRLEQEKIKSKNYPFTIWIFRIVGLLLVSNMVHADNCKENQKSVDQLMLEFRELGFGMFIHFNMATYHGVQWVEGYPEPSTFDPGVDTIDTDSWADAAKAAGMKYAVLTTKHVAGFCLWDSAYTTYDVMHPDCPYQKDLVAQFEFPAQRWTRPTRQNHPNQSGRFD